MSISAPHRSQPLTLLPNLILSPLLPSSLTLYLFPPLPQSNMFAIAFLAVAALLPASAFAAPAAASSSCTSIRTGPLGYNATGIPIYSDQAPYSYLA